VLQTTQAIVANVPDETHAAVDSRVDSSARPSVPTRRMVVPNVRSADTAPSTRRPRCTGPQSSAPRATTYTNAPKKTTLNASIWTKPYVPRHSRSTAQG